MAKKGQQAQLQIEVNNDEEWEKLLLKDGLIVVDIYSEWCGPCLGMQANLKKIKLEVGGDMLQLAVAKSDGITVLKRFRNKSEPTWMFISKGKMVNLMFGANAPKLTRLILDELKKEQAQQQGQATDRTPIDVEEMAPEEQVRYDAAESKEKEIKEKEERKRTKELLERRTKECDNILANLPNFGTALIFPSARDRYKEVLNEILDEAGLNITQTEKVKLNEDILEELLFFSENKFPLKTIEDFSNNKLTFALLFKRSNEHLTGNIDDVVLQMVYGNSRNPPGDEKSPALKLKKIWNNAGKPKEWLDVRDDFSEEQLEEIEGQILLGIWAPPNSLSKAMVLKLLFPNLSNPFKIPDLTAVPLHVALGYDAFKAKDIFELSDKYPDKVMNYGYFTSDIPGDAKLLGKTTEKFEARSAPVTYEEKLVIQLAKDDPHCFMDFLDIGPSYMSRDVDVGEMDCLYFFPPGYNAPEVEIITYLKKKSKRKGKLGKFKLPTDQLQEGDSQLAAAGTESTMDNERQSGEDNGEDTAVIDDTNNEEGDSEEEEGEEAERDEENEMQNDDNLESADKATSPVVAEP